MRSAPLAIAVAVALGVLAYALWPFRVRWQDPYRALEAIAITGTSAERERLRLALAEVASEKPSGWEPGPRLHRPGSLARLRYRTYRHDGHLSAEWQVRALVPPLPAQNADPVDPSAPLRGGVGCGTACWDAITRSGATLLDRSGNPGLAAEWLLRMPLGQEFDLGSRSLTTQDVLDDAERTLSVVSSREGERTVVEPAQIRVTLMEMCAGVARYGTVATLEFFPHAIVPVPKGVSTQRWVQLDGCGALQPLTPVEFQAPGHDSVAHAAGPATESEPAIIGVRRHAGDGRVTLDIDESRLRQRASALGFRLGLICRYDAENDRWQRLPWHYLGVETWYEPRAGESGDAPREVLSLPREAGLYWLRWSESDTRTPVERLQSPDTSGAVRHAALAPVGPMLCEDLRLGPTPTGKVPACVAGTSEAQARFVPDPVIACERTP